MGLLLGHFFALRLWRKVFNLYFYIIHLQTVDYSLIILLFIVSLLIYVKLKKIVLKEKLSNLQILEILHD